MTEFLLKLSFVFAVGAHGADGFTTMYCLGKGTCKEANLILARIEDPAVYGGFKMGTAGATEVLIFDLSKNHPKLAMITNFAVGGLFTGIAIHNSRVTK